MQSTDSIDYLKNVPLPAIEVLIDTLEVQMQEKRVQLRALKDFVILRNQLEQQQSLEQDPEFVALLTKVIIYATGKQPIKVSACCICTNSSDLFEKILVSDGCYEGGHCL